MQPPPRQDYVSIGFGGRGSPGPSSRQQWRRPSCWRRWKQLSRLQRSLILFTLVCVCAVAFYSAITHGHMGGPAEAEHDGPSVLRPGVPQLLPEPDTQRQPLLPRPTAQRKLSSKRGPPVLHNRFQNNTNASELLVKDKAADSKEKGEGEREISFSRRGPMINTDLGRKDIKAVDNNEDSLLNPRDKSAKESASWPEAVRQAFRHAWKGYKDFAWGHDELRPLSKTYSEWFGLGLTLIDALDTMWILGLKEEFEEAKAWVATELTFNKNVDVNLFESTIRILGGLLSTYHLTGDPLFLHKATDMGSRLMPAFNTPSKIPYSDVNIGTGVGRPPRWTSDSTVAEVTSIQLEFRELSRLTQEPRYQVTDTHLVVRR